MYPLAKNVYGLSNIQNQIRMYHGNLTILVEMYPLASKEIMELYFKNL